MHCPHCDKTLPFILCQECGEETPEESLYCCRCGKMIKKEEKADLAERTLCSDGSCIGTINEQRVCNICGKPYTGEETSSSIH